MSVYYFSDIFGPEIKVGFQPRQNSFQYTGYPGANGVTAMQMGFRGYPIVVTGTLRAYGANYRAARNSLTSSITNIEQMQLTGMHDYLWGLDRFEKVVFERFELLSSNGKQFAYTTEGWCFVQFIAYFRALV